MLKRLFDIVFAFLLIIILIPLFLVIVLFIIILDGWPVFFIQQRVGLHGKNFGMFKFRTMNVKKDAEKGSFDAGDVSRITKFGKLLRKSKFDEMPQLLNVFLGSMSIVGPRPEVGKWVEVYPERWFIVHSVKPGITDNASLEFRNEEEILASSINKDETYKEAILPRKLDLYEDYIRKQSFIGDLGIIMKTVYSVVFK